MKVLQLPSYYFPENAASSYLGNNIRESLCDDGICVDIYVPMPCRGVSAEIKKEYKKKKLETRYDGKLTIHRFSMYSEGTNPLLRALRYFLCCCKHFWYGVRAKDVDVLFLASTPPIQGALGALIKKCRKIPFVYNLQDIFPDSLVNNGLTKKGSILWKIGRVIENFTYRNADKIIVISEDFKRNIMAKGVPEEKIEVVYNWVDENAVVSVEREKNELFDKYGIGREKFILSYSGNLGLSQNIDLLLEVMKELQLEKPEIHLVLVGDGAYRKQAEEIVKRDSLKNVSMIPFQPYEDISKVFSLGDAGLVISKPGTGYASVPSKTWSIMSASRPVLANFDENELKDIVEKNECGLFTVAGDKDAFKQAIFTLFNNREMCIRMGKNGRRFVERNLTRKAGTAKYIATLKGIADGK